MKLISRRTHKIISKTTMFCFLNKCEFVFFAYKLGRREYNLIQDIIKLKET